MTFNLEKYCAKKVQVMRNIVYTEKEFQCRICENPQYCENFIPFRPSRMELLYDRELRKELMK
jgi:hypothetical protein